MNQEVKMHETMRVGILLAFVGGFLDVYTYLLRGGVFANAQTGNMVLLTLQISQGHFVQALYYLVPIIAFFMGAVVTEIVKKHDYWHEYVLVIEIILLFGVGLYPLSYPPTLLIQWYLLFVRCKLVVLRNFMVLLMRQRFVRGIFVRQRKI